MPPAFDHEELMDRIDGDVEFLEESIEIFDEDATPLLEKIRKTYSGPLSLAEDHMVWNVTKDKITERIAIVDEHTWCPPMATPAVPPDPKDRAPYSPEIEAGRLNVDDVIKPIYKEASEALGREFKYPDK